MIVRSIYISVNQVVD